MAAFFIKWFFFYHDEINLVRVIGETDDTPLAKTFLIYKAEEYLEKAFDLDVNIIVSAEDEADENYVGAKAGKAIATFQITFSDHNSMQDYLKMMSK